MCSLYSGAWGTPAAAHLGGPSSRLIPVSSWITALRLTNPLSVASWASGCWTLVETSVSWHQCYLSLPVAYLLFLLSIWCLVGKCGPLAQILFLFLVPYSRCGSHWPVGYPSTSSCPVCLLLCPLATPPIQSPWCSFHFPFGTVFIIIIIASETPALQVAFVLILEHWATRCFSPELGRL